MKNQLSIFPEQPQPDGEYFAKGVGLVQQVTDYQHFVDSLEKEPVPFGADLLHPGCLTDLDGWFNVQPIRYCGAQEKWIYLYLGESHGKHYFEKLLLLNRSKLFIFHAGNAGREYNYIKGVWDWERRQNRFIPEPALLNSPAALGKQKRYQPNCRKIWDFI